MTTTTETDYQRESRERAESNNARADLADATRALVTGKLFPALRKLGYVALANREYDEVQESVEKKKAIGYVYWDRDEDRRITPPERRWTFFKFDGISLSFGGSHEDDDQCKAQTKMLGHAIVAQAKLDGLLVEWDGDTNHRVKVSASADVVAKGKVVEKAKRAMELADRLRENAAHELTKATDEYEEAKAAHVKAYEDLLTARKDLENLNAREAL